MLQDVEKGTQASLGRIRDPFHQKVKSEMQRREHNGECPDLGRGTGMVRQRRLQGQSGIRSQRELVNTY